MVTARPPHGSSWGARRWIWALRRRLERGELALPPAEKLADELCGMRWNIGLDGKVQIESKDELPARLGRSLDRAAGVAMALLRRELVRWWLGPIQKGAA